MLRPALTTGSTKYTFEMEYTIPNATVLAQDLAGKNAIVTGASRGIGRGLAFHLAARGANILGTCSSEGSLKHIASLNEEIKSLYKEKNDPRDNHPAPKVVGVVASLTEPKESCAAVVAAVKEHFGGDLNILVQNAAVAEIMKIDESECCLSPRGSARRFGIAKDSRGGAQLREGAHIRTPKKPDHAPILRTTTLLTTRRQSTRATSTAPSQATSSAPSSSSKRSSRTSARTAGS